MSARRLAALIMLFAALVSLATVARSALALDRNFAGSAQFDYHLAPSQPGASAPGAVLDGFTTEVAFKLAIDFSEHLSANVKVCYGCHGFETDMAYVDYRFADELNVRIGRFSPGFGSFNLRHDPANHKLSDKPLPYDMGRMLRLRDWNMGVLPSPFPDNGIEVSGTRWLGGAAALDYAAHVVSGLKGDSDGTDLDFQQSRAGSLYYVDNNDRPSFGGRAALTLKLGSWGDTTFGASAMYGWFDPAAERAYLILGADAVVRIRKTTLRLEYLVRRQDFDVSEPSRFKYEVANERGDFFVKHGGYAEIEHALSSGLDVIGRVDGMYRTGNVLEGSPLQARSAVLRYTIGAAFAVERGLRIKVSSELWSFSDRAYDRHSEVSYHVAAVGTF